MRKIKPTYRLAVDPIGIIQILIAQFSQKLTEYLLSHTLDFLQNFEFRDEFIFRKLFLRRPAGLVFERKGRLSGNPLVCYFCPVKRF